MKLWHKKRALRDISGLIGRLHESNNYTSNFTLKKENWQWSWLNYLNATKY